jgi:hypothetical protein
LVSSDDYEAGIEACKHNIHRRIVWLKGATPLIVVALKNKVTPIWRGGEIILNIGLERR